MKTAVAAALGAALITWTPAHAEDAAPAAAEQTFALHGQSTFEWQANAPFSSPYSGANSLHAGGQGRETFDATFYAGMRAWAGAEIWANPEVDQGFGLSDTLGVAGFPSGEAYKVGKSAPYLKLPRLFLRQTVDLGGERQDVDADLNQLSGRRTADRLVLTIGKFSVVDLFDTNAYAHDPRRDFMNWTLIDAGTFDYPANAWGYTYGAAAELYKGRWAARIGAFDLSETPNSSGLDTGFDQYGLIGELEERHKLFGQDGAVRVTAFLNRGRMGRFDDAVRLAEAMGRPADIAAVRSYRSRSGVSFGVEQGLTKDLGLFVKGGIAGGQVEPYEFTDVDRTIAAGLSLKGARWGRGDDTVGLAGVVNTISKAHQQFLDAGGTGILVGDGQLPHPGAERIVETYYDAAVIKAVHVSLDYQFVQNPAYNRDRGPVSIGAVRVHLQF